MSRVMCDRNLVVDAGQHDRALGQLGSSGLSHDLVSIRSPLRRFMRFYRRLVVTVKGFDVCLFLPNLAGRGSSQLRWM
ncbi:Kinesin-related protein 11 [Fusarium oxysporum f. sp. albedinis]|nr:Kinesin-related protein 11 [Fusarium oxysporum f. sp. albedinis]